MTAVLVMTGLGIGLGLIGRTFDRRHYAVLIAAALAVTVYEFLGGSS
jgi:hypothetical protein